MGISINVDDLEFINVIKDLEMARHTLEVKRNMENNVATEHTEAASPSVEKQLLGGHTETCDDEGFKIVSYRKSEKGKKKVTFCGSREKYLASPSEDANKKG